MPTRGAREYMSEELMSTTDIKQEILAALRHPEAEDGLYFNNLIIVHEEEERPIVRGEESDVLEALRELVKAGTVETVGNGQETIYKLKG
jgi:hypothetical protein